MNAREWLSELERKKDRLTELQKTFFYTRKNAEDYSEIIEKTADLVEKGLKTQADLQRVTHRSVELKFFAEES